MCGSNLVILAQICYHADKPNFLEFWVKMAKMFLKVKVNDLHFQHQLRVSHDACLVQIWWFQPKSVWSCQADKPNFLEFWAKWSKWPWSSRSMTSNTNWEYPMKDVWCKFDDSSSNLSRVMVWTWKSLRTDRQMDGRTERWTDAGNDNTPLAWKAKG